MRDDKLITLVSTNPLLYDKNCWEFKNGVKKKHVWDSIAKQLGVSAEICMKRWVALREKLGREMRLLKDASENGEAIVSKWRHYEQMQFLCPHMLCKKRPTNSSFLNTNELLDHSLSMKPFENSREQMVRSPTTMTDIAASPTISDRSLPTPPLSQASAARSSLKRRKRAKDDETAAFLEVSEALQNYLANSQVTVKDPLSHSFGQFVASCLEVMDHKEKNRIILEITNLLMVAKQEKND